MSRDCNEKVWCDFCLKDNHSTTACFSKNRTASTPKIPPTTMNSTTDQNNTADHNNTTDLMQTRLDNDAKMRNKKYRLKKVKEFDGNKKDQCITWIEHNKTAAREVGIPLREALLERSTGDVFEVISSSTSNDRT